MPVTHRGTDNPGPKWLVGEPWRTLREQGRRRGVRVTELSSRTQCCSGWSQNMCPSILPEATMGRALCLRPVSSATGSRANSYLATQMLQVSLVSPGRCRAACHHPERGISRLRQELPDVRFGTRTADGFRAAPHLAGKLQLKSA